MPVLAHLRGEGFLRAGQVPVPHGRRFDYVIVNADDDEIVYVHWNLLVVFYVDQIRIA